MIRLLVHLLFCLGPTLLMAADTPFAPAEWPRYLGPAGTGATEAPGPLVADLGQAKLLWLSEERNLPLGWGLGHGGSNKARTTMRGASYSGPVVADGKVFLQYQVPKGEARIELDDKGRSFDIASKKDPRPESYALAAVDVVLCLDAATGATRWRAELPGGTSFNYSRNETFQHPCVVGGVAFVQGTGGRAHAVKVEDGSVLWTRPLGPGTAAWDDYRARCSAAKKAIWGRQVFNVSPDWCDGVVCFNDQTHQTGRQRASGLVALDANTGALLWSREQVMGRLVSPSFCRLGDTVGVIAVSSGRGRWWEAQDHLRCFELKTGKLLWEVECQASSSQTPRVWGDRLLLSTIGVRGGLGSLHRKLKEQKKIDPKKVSVEDVGRRYVGWRCYALSPEGPKELWTLPLARAGNNVTPVLHRDRLWLQTLGGLIAVDPEDGTILAEGPKVDGYVPLMACGDRLFQYGRMYDIAEREAVTPAGAIKGRGFKTYPYGHSCVAGGRIYLRVWITDDSLAVGDAPERGAIACYELGR